MLRMAETAYQVHQEAGEEAMLFYLLFTQEREDQPLWANGDTCTLRDGSTVHRNLDSIAPYYRFQWEDQEAPQGRRQETMPATVTRLPEPPAPVIPLLDWPNSHSIMIRVMELADQKARHRLGLPPGDRTGRPQPSHGHPPPPRAQRPGTGQERHRRLERRRGCRRPREPPDHHRR